VPISDRDQFFEWTNTAIFADDPDMSTTRAGGEIAVANMIGYAMQLAEQRRKQPDNELVDTLLNGEVDGEAISEIEFGMMFVLLMIGGNESIRTVIAHGMRLLIEHPEKLDYLVQHPDHLDAAIEEILRYNTPFICMRRTAMADVEIGGESIQACDKVILYYSSVNH
jgi:cholest-4-en-3-one 26-monooxygenase